KLIREDLKLDVSLQPSGYQKVDSVSRDILKTINESGGSMAVTDKSPPGEIYDLFGVSKKTFKKAIGTLYKKRLITMDSRGIRLVGNRAE
ncbi:MAG: GntR family transcriptional regulator, partial [Deltaproteobacteria bacterium]|nr:GntR family transcriptional regulator [Deltaproteobacteria bacterium]